MTGTAIVLILISLQLNHHFVASTLSPYEFDRLKGYPFCSYGSDDQLAAMCFKMGDKLGYSKLKTSECDNFTVYLQDDEPDAEWVSRDTYLLECVFGQPKKSIYLGDGIYTNDVFLYEPDKDGDKIALGNYGDFLTGIFR